MGNHFNENLVFLKSALAGDGSFISTDDVITWLKKRNESVTIKIKKVRFETGPGNQN